MTAPRVPLQLIAPSRRLEAALRLAAGPSAGSVSATLSYLCQQLSALCASPVASVYVLEDREPVAERCVACYLIGEASRELTRDLDGTVPLHPVGDLERAVRTAAAAARPGQVVLLSPACASYDQYRDFEERGEHFRQLVQGLASGE